MGHLPSKSEIIAILRRFDLDGDAKINFDEFTEAIKTQLGVSRPRRLRENEVLEEKAEKEAARAVSVKSNRSGITAATRKRQQSAKYEPGFSPRKNLNVSQHGILKPKSRKSRP